MRSVEAIGLEPAARVPTLSLLALCTYAVLNHCCRERGKREEREGGRRKRRRREELSFFNFD
jgi:hypothetical protein